MYFWIFWCSYAILLILICQGHKPYHINFLYSMNSWNLNSSNSRLQILQKTQSHRKHLMNLISAKTCLKTHSAVRPRHQYVGSIDILSKKEVEKNNTSMIQRIVKISKTHSESLNSSESRALSRNLKTYSSMNRSIKLKKI